MEGTVVKLVKRRFDEETAKKEVAKVSIFDKEICESISVEQHGKRESVDKRAEIRGRELGPIEEHEEEDEQGGEVRDRGREAEFWRECGFPIQQDRF